MSDGLRASRRLRSGLVVVCLLFLGCCGSRVALEPDEPPERLSAHGLFRGDGSTQEPAEDVVPYDVNTPLFSDYAVKYRFVRLPPGASAEYHDTESFAFPVGTVLVKTFAYLNDPYRYGVMRSPLAAGRGTGGRLYDIVPGRPDESILLHRIESTEPGVMMPELGRRLVDVEGAALVREWIASLSVHP